MEVSTPRTQCVTEKSNFTPGHNKHCGLFLNLYPDLFHFYINVTTGLVFFRTQAAKYALMTHLRAIVRSSFFLFPEICFVLITFQKKKTLLLFWNGRSLAQKAPQENVWSHVFYSLKKVAKKSNEKSRTTWNSFEWVIRSMQHGET